MKDRKSFDFPIVVFPLGILSCHVPQDTPIGLTGFVDYQRKMACEKTAVIRSHQSGEAVATHEGV